MTIERKHIRIFFIHFTLWALIYGLFLFPFFFQMRQQPPDLPNRLVLVIALFYINYYLLVPKILLRKNTLYYILSCSVLIVSVALIINYDIVPAPRIPPNFPRREGPPFDNHFIRDFITILNLSAPIVISAFVRVYLEWRKNEDLRKRVESEKITSELQFLKTQLNPHFLFNSLNAIYSLSVKNSRSTSDAIISLSELMRYMLYETDKELVPLGKEIEYIKNYVQLQRLRLSDSTNVKLKISGEEKGKQIPPLLFISFIENAFKYGTDYKGKTNVEINLTTEGNVIHFMVNNKIGNHRKKEGNSGVGLENIKNRLKLLYPDSHNLKIKNDGTTFMVEVTLVT